MGLKGVKVNGQTYHFDHEYLENNPIPAFDPTEGNDLHCVLTVEESFLEWQSAERFLTGNTANDGDVLTVEKNGSYTELVWKSIGGGSSPLPTYDTTYPSVDEGKVLTVNDCGSLEWTDVRSGGGSDIGQYIDDWDSSDVGRVLTVTSGCALGWTNILPVGGSSGNVLTMGADGEPYWADMVSSGGSEYNSMPSFGAGDIGKVLMVVSDSGLAWQSNSELPDIENANDGKVPIIVSGNHIEWGSELPEYDDSDEGKVLMIQNGELAWEEIN